jgi:hypothetical protein
MKRQNVGLPFYFMSVLRRPASGVCWWSASSEKFNQNEVNYAKRTQFPKSQKLA